jgi:hypothetical protein
MFNFCNEMLPPAKLSSTKPQAVVGGQFGSMLFGRLMLTRLLFACCCNENSTFLRGHNPQQKETQIEPLLKIRLLPPIIDKGGI